MTPRLRDRHTGIQVARAHNIRGLSLPMASSSGMIAFFGKLGGTMSDLDRDARIRMSRERDEAISAVLRRPDKQKAGGVTRPLVYVGAALTGLVVIGGVAVGLMSLGKSPHLESTSDDLTVAPTAVKAPVVVVAPPPVLPPPTTSPAPQPVHQVQAAESGESDWSPRNTPTPHREDPPPPPPPPASPDKIVIQGLNGLGISVPPLPPVNLPGITPLPPR